MLEFVRRESPNDFDSNFLAFPCFYQESMAGDKHFSVKYFMPLYSYEERVASFQRQIGLSNPRHEEYVILGPCSKRDRSNMYIRDIFPNPYFNIHLPIIHDLGDLIPFTPFEAKLLVAANISPSKITHNVWGIIREFKILCRWFELPATVWVFFSSYGIILTPISVWVTLFYLLGKKLLKPHLVLMQILKINW